MSETQARAAQAKAGSLRLTPIRLWVGCSVALNLIGWGLSLLNELDAKGYVVSIGLGLAGLGTWHVTGRQQSRPGSATAGRRFVRRLKHPLPCCFFVMATLVLLGGWLHAPNNDDALSYRIPRVLNWLAEHRWHWIHTPHPAMNSHVTGHEWLLAPWIALGGTDRWIFLINFAAFLLLPGLVFSVFRGLDVRARVAWHWMWLVPSGYSFILQAGGDANDLLGVVNALAAMHFALRAKRSRRISDAWFAIFAAALMTGCKLSNLPLLLPIALALLSSARLLPGRPVATTFVLLAAAVASVVPMAAINRHYCGDWTGTANESKVRSEETTSSAAGKAPAPLPYIFVIKDPLVGLTGNGLSLASANLLPPVMPAGWWNAHILEFFPALYCAKLKENFEPDFLRVRIFPGEEQAGLGFGLCWLLALGWVVARYRGVEASAARWFERRTRGAVAERVILRWSPFFALGFFMIKSGISAAARIVAPYYALLMPALLQGPAAEQVVRSRWWRRGEIAAYLVAFGVLIIAPERPLWPARAVLAALERSHPNSQFLRSAAVVHEVYSARPDAFAPIRDLMPEHLATIGMLCVGNEPSTSLWRPFGQTRVRQLFFSDTRAELHEWGIEYVVAHNTGAQFEAWLQNVGGEVLGSKDLKLYASRDPVTWAVVRLKQGEQPAVTPTTQ